MGWTVGDGVSEEERHVGSKDVEECVRECYKLGVSQEKKISPNKYQLRRI